MIPAELISDINLVRTRFLEAVELLEKSASVRSLPESAPLRNAIRTAREVAGHRLVRRTCDGRIVCAFIGSSGHGKTTFLSELFPDLGQRGWLVTEKNDTTAQSLRIEYADGPAERERVVVNSWTLDQIKLLVGSPAAREQNERDNIEVHYRDQDGCVVVDGTRANLPKADLDQFQFALRQELRPLPQPYTVPADRLEDREFIRALTIKELPGKLSKGTVLTADGQAFNALQLRAIVKDVTLHDSFTRLGTLCGRPPEEFKSLVFVDTPGLATTSGLKDEVLRHCLEQKSNRIAVELWKDDELDVIVHLVLCGEQSNFATLWKAIEGECGPEAVRDLQERVILLVNGVNLYFENADLNKKFKDPEIARSEGDHFATTLVDNILQKMSPRGRFRPAKVCFADSKRIVEGGFLASSYEGKYRTFREAMLKWVDSGGVGRETLDELGLTDNFRKNIDALADPDDRGQGFLARQILDLTQTKGPALLLKKHLVRTGLMGALRDLPPLLARYYGADGSMSREAICETLRTCLGFLDPEDPQAIERFATDAVDPDIDSLFKSRNGVLSSGNWVEASFRRTTKRVCDGILDRARVDPHVATAFRDYVGDLVDTWAESWGYAGASLRPPSRQSPATGDLLKHCLKFHAREVVYQLSEEALADAGEAAFVQDQADRQRVQRAMTLLDEAARVAEEWCSREKVRS
jgi:hypothetical protein